MQVAVYKTPSGDIEKFSGLCPHLGCLLQVRQFESCSVFVVAAVWSPERLTRRLLYMLASATRVCPQALLTDRSSFLYRNSTPSSQQFSPDDGEWHCPCHGSCFSAEGKNLAGPATIDMKRLD